MNAQYLESSDPLRNEERWGRCVLTCCCWSFTDKHCEIQSSSTVSNSDTVLSLPTESHDMFSNRWGVHALCSMTKYIYVLFILTALLIYLTGIKFDVLIRVLTVSDVFFLQITSSLKLSSDLPTNRHPVTNVILYGHSHKAVSTVWSQGLFVGMDVWRFGVICH